MKLANTLLSFFALLVSIQGALFYTKISGDGMCACAKTKKTLSEKYLETSAKCTVIIKCFAHWCPSCKDMEQVFQDVSQELSSQQCHFFSVDIDQHEDIIDTFNIKSIPTILILHNKEVKEKLSGTHSAEALKSKIMAYQE